MRMQRGPRWRRHRSRAIAVVKEHDGRSLWGAKTRVLVGCTNSVACRIPQFAGRSNKRTPRALMLSPIRLACARGIALGSLPLVFATLPLAAAGCGGERGTAADKTADVVRATERERLRALVAGDLEIARKLHANDFQLINPAGDTVSKEQYLVGIELGSPRYNAFKPVSPMNVRVYDGAAVIRYRAHIECCGRDGVYWYTDVYEKRDGRWQIVWAQVTSAAEQ